MLMVVKRLTVWLLETSMGILLLGLLLIVLFGHDQHAFGRDLLAYLGAIVAMAFSTGYLLSTAVSRAFWRGRTLWSYPTLATLLFVIHSQLFFVVSGGSTQSEKLSIQAPGLCIVFACTLAGTFILRKWAPARSKLAEPQP